MAQKRSCGLEWNTSPNGDGTSYQPNDTVTFSDTFSSIKLYAIFGLVASIGITNYNTLALAVSAAQGDTVTLLDDFTLKADVSLNKDITLEGNSKTITIYGSDAYLLAAKDTTISIQNLSLIGSNAERGIIAEESTLTLDNLKLTSGFSEGILVNSSTF